MILCTYITMQWNLWVDKSVPNDSKMWEIGVHLFHLPVQAEDREIIPVEVQEYTLTALLCT